jgi:hypothetical protein
MISIYNVITIIKSKKRWPARYVAPDGSIENCIHKFDHARGEENI